VVGELFRIGRSVAREVDKAGQEVFRISEAEERRFGERFHAALRTEFDIEANGPTSRRLVRLATPILSRRSRSGPTYRFFVVGDPRPNAFAHAGGYVYVTRGLLELGVSDDELQFALAHEIAHVELGHVLATLAYWVQARKVAGEPAGEVAAMLHSLIATGYSQDKEFAADAWALRAMLASGKSRAGAIGLLQRLQREEGPEKENRGPGTKPASAAEAVARELGDHFRSHPPTRDRIERLEEIDE
jgi:Zn-dependent protease with chaperone function